MDFFGRRQTIDNEQEESWNEGSNSEWTKFGQKIFCQFFDPKSNVYTDRKRLKFCRQTGYTLVYECSLHAT